MLTYPNGNYQLPYEYGTANESNDLISRIVRLDIHGLDNGADYSYVGLGLVALLDLAGPNGSLDVRLTRWHDHDGSTLQGKYPGFDRFGRVQRHLWADQSFTTHGSTSGYSNIPAIAEITHSFDKASNVLTSLDRRQGANAPIATSSTSTTNWIACRKPTAAWMVGEGPSRTWHSTPTSPPARNGVPAWTSSATGVNW